MNIKNEQKNIDNCRFCFMCRHVCTVAVTTREEEMSPRSKALMLSMVLREAEEYTQDIADLIYQCCLCGYCRMWCEGGWDFMKAAVAARKDLSDKGLVPEQVASVINTLKTAGSLYPAPPQRDTFLKDLQGGADSLLLVFGDGALNADFSIAKAAVSLVKKAGLKPSALEKEAEGGLSLYFLGAVEEGKKRINTFFKAVESSGCQKIVAVSPDVYFLLTQDIYEDIRFKGNTNRVIHISQFILEQIDNGTLEIGRQTGSAGRAVFHDNDFLSRLLSKPVIDEPRAILEKVPGVELVTLFHDREKTRSLGGPLFRAAYPDVAAELGKLKINEISEQNPRMVLTLSGDDKTLLKAAMQLDSEQGYEVRDLVEFVDAATG
jgi:Fe-S oxidoreductase